MNNSLRNQLLIVLFLSSALINLHAQETIIQYLSGTDKDHTVQWDFMVNNGRKSGQWSKIAVPSCWETQGFGTYSYGRDINGANETGMYKYRFNVSPSYHNKKIFLVFEASMTDTEVKINGKSAGPVHQGGFYEFSYDITNLVDFSNPNLLEVTVSKKSSNVSINRAERQSDFWLFGGIYRPVYLQIPPTNFIERVAIDAKANGDFNIQVAAHPKTEQYVEAQVFDLSGKMIDKPFVLPAGDSIMHHHFPGIKTWNPEEPNLYNVVVSLKEGSKTIHTFKQRFGFRTAELRREDGFYVNGKKVIFKGVNRHSEWPETGRTLSRAVHLMDIAVMRKMNMNAVRMSHYPPDKEFLELCDSIGLFVLDELTGWQKAYDTITARRLVKEMVTRDVNHPSIVIWDNGNEGGWNRAVDNNYRLYDPQDRLVIHPWERFNGTNTKHYPDYKYIQNEVANPKEVFFPTEFMHGLFDGGHGAALEDFWNLMMKHPHAAGGFLWSLHDEGLVRQDWHDSIDVAGNLAPDGIVGPHREREGSFYTIREIWSPVYIETTGMERQFNGKIEVENRYLYTNLNTVRFEWKLAMFPSPYERTTRLTIVKKGSFMGPSIEPGAKGIISIPLPKDFQAQALYLTAFDRKGDTICPWSWQVPLRKAVALTTMVKPTSLTTKETGREITIFCDGISYSFDKTTGFLGSVIKGKNKISFGGGPALAGSSLDLREFRSYRKDNEYIIESDYIGDSLKVKWSFHSGGQPRLDYSYLTKDTVEFMGITFNYPEEKITGIKYLGRGPYRVWKNRLKGQQLGAWQKTYNNTITGENWSYPEFKGYYANVRWVQLQNMESNFLVFPGSNNIYLQVLHPTQPKAAANNNTTPPFPQGSIGFMNAIPAIGTKFQSAELMGPQSQKTVRQGNVSVSGTLYFDFR